MTVEIAVGGSTSAGSVGAGGVAFDAVAVGTTTVQATAPGFDPTISDASRVITVSPLINRKKIWSEYIFQEE